MNQSAAFKSLLWSISLLSLPLHAADAVRLGIVGTDTSHTVAFAKVLNDEKSPDHIAGARIVAAYKGGSPDIKESSSRVEKYAQELHEKWNVQIVDKISDLCSAVDGILLESVDGRVHLQQAKEAMKCGKPMFIDKPLASTLEDAKAIAALASKSGVPWFSASSLRYSQISSIRADDMSGAFVWGPGPLEEHHKLSLSWYGIHAVEMLYTVMGTGCEEVTQVSSPNSDVITGRWKDGRTGTVRVDRPYGQYGGVVFRGKEKVKSITDMKFSYVPLVQDIVKFMNTKNPPVPNTETLEIFAFMDAAQRSKDHNGAPAKLR